MAEINIDLKGLGDKSLLIKKTNLELKEEFETISREIKSTGKIWKSQTATTLENNYKNHDKKIQDFYKDLDSYADFLMTVAEEYGYVEKKIKKNAESFID